LKVVLLARQPVNAARWVAGAVSTLLSLEVKQREISQETKTAFTTAEGE
jgi:hypothetical protein